MKKFIILLPVFCCLMALFACNNTRTYADMKEDEKNTILEFITANNINVISMNQFLSQDSVTDVSKNQFVLFEDKGLYMQIVRKGAGEKLKDGETKTILCRYIEYSLEKKDTISANIYNSSVVDKMTVTNTKGTYEGSFEEGYMLNTYQNSSVPGGWLAPLPYINLTRKASEIAKVRIICPHSQGTANATQNVYACYYEITYELGR